LETSIRSESFANMSDPKIEGKTRIAGLDPGGINASSGPKSHDTEDTTQSKSQLKRFNNDAPDGSTAPWLVVLDAWCTSFSSFGWLNSRLSSHHEASRFE